MIKAIKILKENKLNLNLIIIGQKSDETENIFNEIKNLKLSSNVRIFSNLDNDENTADIFIYPSLYEGFGIPIRKYGFKITNSFK